MGTMAQANPQSGTFSAVLPTLAALLLLATFIALITGIALLFPGPAWIPMWNLNREAYDSFHRLGAIAVVVLFALAGVSATAAAGLLLRKRWAWWIALGLFATNGTGDLVSLIRTREILRFGSGALIAAAFILLLVLPQVRQRLQ
jgi:hypothetical protein